jgi:putative transposase
VVDEGDRRPIGRPWLTLAIDVASRAVLGFSVSLERPSVVSVALTLVQAVLPKDLWLADRQLEVPWPMWGLPELLQLDNAAEFHSRALVRGAQEYGIRIDYRPPGTPHFGGHIERLIGTTMGAVHLLPGTTFSNVAEKGAYQSEKTSALTLVELERWLALQVGGVYHQSVHASLLKPPVEQREAMKRLRTEGRRLVDERLIFETALAQRKFVDSARKSTARKRRNKERLLHLQATSSNTRVASDSAQTFEDSSLPPFGVEEWS